MKLFIESEEIVKRITKNLQQVMTDGSIGKEQGFIFDSSHCNIKVNLNNDLKTYQLKVSTVSKGEIFTLNTAPAGSFPSYTLSLRNKRLEESTKRKMLSFLAMINVENALNNKLVELKNENEMLNNNNNINQFKKATPIIISETPQQKLITEVIGYFKTHIDNENVKNNNNETNNTIEKVLKSLQEINNNNYILSPDGKLNAIYKNEDFSIKITKDANKPDWEKIEKFTVSIYDKNDQEMVMLRQHADSYEYDCYAKGSYLKKEYANWLVNSLPLSTLFKQVENKELNIAQLETVKNVDTIHSRIGNIRSKFSNNSLNNNALTL